MKRLTIALTTICLAALALAPAAQADFGFYDFDVTFTDGDGSPATQAGGHPFAQTTRFGLNFDEAAGLPEDRFRDGLFEQVRGLAGDTTAYRRCATLQFLELVEGINACPLETQVGIVANATSDPGLWSTSPVFNVAPPPGVLIRLGFRVGGTVNIFVDVRIAPQPPHLPVALTRNTPQVVDVFGSALQLWGNPSADAHDGLRGKCGHYTTELAAGEIAGFDFEAGKGTGSSCPVGDNPKPFLTSPTSCAAPLASRYEALSWTGATDSGLSLTHDAAGAPQPFTGCEKLPFKPSLEARPTSRAAQSPTGLEVSLGVEDEGLTSVTGLAQSQIEEVITTLPEGVTANPSLAEGLEVCSEGDIDDETLAAQPGEGCPQASKIGTVEVESPLVDRIIRGSLFVAEPYENPFDSLLALYIVLKDRDLGIRVVQPLKVEPDPETGQLVTVAKDIPQLPFSDFRLRFREGGRSPLISPPTCGTYETEAELVPWSGVAPILSTSSFEVISGPGEGPCPPGGTPPFSPGFEAGSINNAAGRFSPFYMRLTRKDGEQDMTKFSATLPPGVVGKLAGVPYCPEAAIAAARGREGKDELARPSCPAASQIGRAVGGAGVGSQLTFVPGSVYLAGPYNGAPLSVVAIVPAVAGPFDVGNVVTRQALRIDPLTAEVTADGASSDPIPHILAGIPLSVREIRVYVDRPGFTLNPTSCEESATKATLFGGFTDVFSPHDDLPVPLASRYQAAGCASLGFKPRLGLSLRGGTRRGAHPALRGVFRPRPGQANLKRMVLRLPTSAFLDQGHIRTICTRVQFAANACPKGAIYGRARAFTPLLDTPLEGPVYLRSSDNNLPDFVAALKGIVDVEAVARIDSVRGGIRATFSQVPDAPLTRVVVNMQGGKKGLIVNSRHLCHKAKRNRANAGMVGHNGKRRKIRPVVRAVACKKQRKARRSSHRR